MTDWKPASDAYTIGDLVRLWFDDRPLILYFDAWLGGTTR